MSGITPELLTEARNHVTYYQTAQVTSLQRRVGVDYRTACLLLDLLEAEGMVGPAKGCLPREVLVRAEPGSYL